MGDATVLTGSALVDHRFRNGLLAAPLNTGGNIHRKIINESQDLDGSIRRAWRNADGGMVSTVCGRKRNRNGVPGSCRSVLHNELNLQVYSITVWGCLRSKVSDRKKSTTAGRIQYCTISNAAPTSLSWCPAFGLAVEPTEPAQRLRRSRRFMPSVHTQASLRARVPPACHFPPASPRKNTGKVTAAFGTSD